MAKQLVQYEADDGSKFDSAEEADAHSEMVANNRSVERYLSAAVTDRTHAVVLRRHIPQYLAFVKDGTVPVPEVKKVRKPRKPKVAPAPAAEKA